MPLLGPSLPQPGPLKSSLTLPPKQFLNECTAFILPRAVKSKAPAVARATAVGSSVSLSFLSGRIRSYPAPVQNPVSDRSPNSSLRAKESGAWTLWTRGSSTGKPGDQDTAFLTRQRPRLYSRSHLGGFCCSITAWVCELHQKTAVGTAYPSPGKSDEQQ